MGPHTKTSRGSIAMRLALILATLSVPCLVSSQQPPRELATPGAVRIEYVAHACFRLTSPGGDRVLIDPFASRVWLGYDFPPGIETDAILITHPHYDHDGGVSVGRQPPWAEGSTVLRAPGEYEVGEFKILGVAGKHADPWGKEFGQTNTIWSLEVAGLRIAHLGDNGPVSKEARAKLGRVDLLLIPIDDEYHILKRQEIENILKELSPRVVVPMHYRHPDLETDESSPKDLGGIEGWLEEREEVRRSSSNKAEVSIKELPEDQEVLVLEHWPGMGPP